MGKAKVDGATVAEAQNATASVPETALDNAASVRQDNAAEMENAASPVGAEADLSAAAPANNFDIALSEAHRQINEMTQALNPLAGFLRKYGVLPSAGEVITVAMIADAALQALQEAKAGEIEMQGKIEALTPDPSQVKSKRTKPIAVASKVEDEEFEHAATVVFGDSDGNQITVLAPLSFSSDKFGGSAVGRTLNADIEFPVHGPARTVAAAFLVDAKGKAVSICELVSPLSVSGGGSARINSGSLLFRAPEKPKADAKAA